MEPFQGVGIGHGRTHSPLERARTAAVPTNPLDPEAAISPKARALIGILTTLFFVISGISFLLSERYTIGGILVFFGMLRGAAAFQQIAWMMEPDEEDE